jgi:hemoglobin
MGIIKPMQPSPPTSSAHPWGDAESPYVELGGEHSLKKLVESFYDIIEEESPVLRSMLPANTANSRLKLFEFLSGWMGGPQIYWEKRGHPRLRMRHFPFTIGDEEAKEWVRCMEKAMDENRVRGEIRSFLVQKLTESALHLRNKA